MRPIYIFDLDGTLALIQHRRHLVERPPCPYCGWHKKCQHDDPLDQQSELKGERPKFKADWPGFFAACVDDEPNDSVIRTMQGLKKAGAECWVWSGRSDEVREQTVAWLKKHSCLPSGWWFGDSCRAPEAFLMRKAGDHRDDVSLKRGWLAEVEPPEYKRIVGVFDDRDRVVAMWREVGLTCFQVAPGAF